MTKGMTFLSRISRDRSGRNNYCGAVCSFNFERSYGLVTVHKYNVKVVISFYGCPFCYDSDIGCIIVSAFLVKFYTTIGVFYEFVVSVSGGGISNFVRSAIGYVNGGATN